jgi:hypothetical protein
MIVPRSRAIERVVALDLSHSQKSDGRKRQEYIDLRIEICSLTSSVVRICLMGR